MVKYIILRKLKNDFFDKATDKDGIKAGLVGLTRMCLGYEA